MKNASQVTHVIDLLVQTKVMLALASYVPGLSNAKQAADLARSEETLKNRLQALLEES